MLPRACACRTRVVRRSNQKEPTARCVSRTSPAIPRFFRFSRIWHVSGYTLINTGQRRSVAISNLDKGVHLRAKQRTWMNARFFRLVDLGPLGGEVLLQGGECVRVDLAGDRTGLVHAVLEFLDCLVGLGLALLPPCGGEGGGVAEAQSGNHGVALFDDQSGGQPARGQGDPGQRGLLLDTLLTVLGLVHLGQAEYHHRQQRYEQGAE